MNQQSRTQSQPAKYALLKQAESLSLSVPKSLLIDTHNLFEHDIETFLNSCGDARFIVRSANIDEDGSEFSLAGHFWSSEAVKNSEVFSIIALATQENNKVLTSLGLDTAPSLILQEYIEHTVGGVLFSPWSFFTDYAYVEYSKSGVKNVVEGSDSQRAIISLDPEYDDLLAPPEHLKPRLVSLCEQLRQHFDFPVDSEWAYDSQQQRLVVLQIRPQTHLVGPISSETTHSTLDTRWQFNALSESLGRLSPLSFSLVKKLYEDTRPALTSLGCKAEHVDFMHYADDGTILIDPTLEKAFYKMTLFGGFKRGLQHTKSLEAVLKVMIDYNDSSAFSYDTLLSLFQHWVITNVMSAGAGRNNTTDKTDAHSTHPYELMWPVQLPKITPPTTYSWVDLNRWGRSLFLFELNKLKQVLAISSSNSHQAFCTWSEYLNSDNSQAKQRQHAQAKGAMYDHALLSTTLSNGTQALSTTKVATGMLFVITEPSHFNAVIPENCILVAPYFDNRWVGAIAKLRGIVVNKGSHLSHSAIVAREHSVPYYVNEELDIGELVSTQQVILDAGKVSPT